MMVDLDYVDFADLGYAFVVRRKLYDPACALCLLLYK